MQRRTAVAAGLAALALFAGACSADGGSPPSGSAADSGARAPGGALNQAEEPAGGATDTRKDAQSTFAVDVDTASYGYAKRLIAEGRLPEPGNVRPEEFVNAFRQDYRQPDGDGFAISVDGARLPRGEGTHLVRVGLQTRAEDKVDRADAALTFVIDVSGSMAEPGRLDLVQDALRTLVNQLRPTDSVAIVAFSDEARVIRKMTRISDRASLLGAIDELGPESSTNLEEGLRLGYQVAREGFRKGASNRVIILSDGLANVGNTESSPILAQVREEAGKQIALLGVGVGSEYGDKLMEQLADNGDGFVVYVSEPGQARDVFVKRLPSTLAVRALDAKVQVTFDPTAVKSYRLIGYENRAVADNDFRNNAVDGGEVGPGHSVTALYEVTPTGVGDTLGRVDVRWLDPGSRKASEATTDIRLSQVDGSFASAATRFKVSYVAGYFAEGLRGGSVDLRDLIPVAEAAAESTEDADVRELAELIRRAQALE